MNKQPEITDATRQRILDAFWRLFKDMPPEKITAGKLSQAAGIHRSSFYRYFSDVYEVFEVFQAELLARLVLDTKAILDTTDFSLPIYTEKTAEVLLTHADKIYRLLNYPDCNFKNQLTKNISDNLKSVLSAASHNDHMEYVVSFVTSCMFANFNFWYNHQDTYTLQEVNAMGHHILLNGLEINE